MGDQSDLSPRGAREPASQANEEKPSRLSNLERERPELLRALRITASSFSGPLPPPEVLAAYEEALPGSAERIIRMAEEQGSHRREMEKQEITANIKSQTRGQYLAFVLAFIVSLGGIYLLATGHGVEGLVALLTPLAGLVGLFLVTRSRARKEAESAKDLRKALGETPQTPIAQRDHGDRSGSGSEPTSP